MDWIVVSWMLCLLANETGLEDGLKAAEALACDIGDDVLRELVSLLLVGVLKGRLPLGKSQCLTRAS